jgi:hypothetical protein
MADEPDDKPKKTRNARFKLLVHEDPDNDQLILYVDYRSVHVRMIWRDSERSDVEDLLAQGTWFLDRGHQELLIQQGSSQIDTDLASLFPEEEVEDGE